MTVIFLSVLWIIILLPSGSSPLPLLLIKSPCKFLFLFSFPTPDAWTLFWGAQGAREGFKALGWSSQICILESALWHRGLGLGTALRSEKAVAAVQRKDKGCGGEGVREAGLGGGSMQVGGWEPKGHGWLGFLVRTKAGAVGQTERCWSGWG